MEAILPLDLGRMFLGDAPPLFYVEICVRVAIIWIWSMALLRWIGRRSVSQMSLVEFLLVIALGSAIGDGMFYPDVPLFHAMLVVALVVGLDKLVDLLIRRFPRSKSVFDGLPVVVVRDGKILWDALGARQVAATEIMERLRLHGITNLGEVEAAVLEPSGQMSVLPAAVGRCGLAIMPPTELCAPTPHDGCARTCCRTCGWMAEGAPPPVCPNCARADWTRAERPQPRRGGDASAPSA